jgi:transcriptional regulator with XRE-family HTH domain
MDSLAGRRVAAALKWLRKTQGLSQRELGTALGWSQAQVKKLENLQTPNVGVVAIEDLCRRFKLSWGYFHAPGPADMDPATYDAASTAETRLELVAQRLEERIDQRVAEAVRAQQKKDPPSAPRRRLASGG